MDFKSIIILVVLSFGIIAAVNRLSDISSLPEAAAAESEDNSPEKSAPGFETVATNGATETAPARVANSQTPAVDGLVGKVGSHSDLEKMVEKDTQNDLTPAQKRWAMEHPDQTLVKDQNQLKQTIDAAEKTAAEKTQSGDILPTFGSRDSRTPAASTK